MIFVTLGTQDKSFVRLLIELERLIDANLINEEVIVQAGSTKFQSKHMKIFDFVDMDSFSDYMKRCDLLITHGGVGSIINGLNQHKKVIAVARLKKYGEHENDHQVQIIEKFFKSQFIIGCLNVNELENALHKIKEFTALPYSSNNQNFCSLIDKLIRE